MSTYVISDIHGCYNEFLNMLDKISFSNDDYLIIAGDYIDRGKQSYEMLRWIEHCPDNIRLLRGNHEEEFVAYIDFMFQIDQKWELGSDLVSNEDAAALYDSVKYYLKNMKPSAIMYFDAYGTIDHLLKYSSVTLSDLKSWVKIIRKMPYYCEINIGKKKCIVVHAGFTERLENIIPLFSSLEQFYLYARAESCQLGGIQHGMVIAGHTPTIHKEGFAYNKGNVFRYYDKIKDCIFYDIDCGCVFRGQVSDAKLACIRLEDEKIFYG